MLQLLLSQLSQGIDRAIDIIGKTIAWLCIVLLLTTGLVVLLRYLFQYGSIAMQESIIYINALIFTVGAAYTLKEKAHVRVDIFYNRLSTKGQNIVDLAGVLFFLLPCGVFIFWQSWDYVALSWRIKESSAEVSGLPLVYLLKATIFLLSGLLIVQGLSELSKNLIALFFPESSKR